MDNGIEIKDFNQYLIYPDGKIYSKKRKAYLNINIERFKKQKLRVQVCLTSDKGIRKGRLLHRLVALHFIENPENKSEVNHKDGDCYNNHVNNLEWVTKQENMKHVSKMGLIKVNNCGRCVIQYDKTGNLVGEYTSIYEAARHTQILSTTIDKVLKGLLKYGGGYVWKYKAPLEIEGEIWKKIIIKDINTGYEVSNMGRVKNKKGRYIKGHKHNFEYIIIDLRYNGKRKTKPLHSLVAEAFLPNLENKPYVDHIDTNTLNNKADNLRWVTHSENMNNKMSKNKITKPVHQMDDDDNIIRTFESIKKARQYITDIYGCKHPKIAAVCKGKKNHKTAGGFKWKYA